MMLHQVIMILEVYQSVKIKIMNSYEIKLSVLTNRSVKYEDLVEYIETELGLSIANKNNPIINDESIIEDINIY